MNKGKVYFLDTTHPLLPESLEKMGYHCIDLLSGDHDAVCKHIGDARGIVIRSRVLVDRKLMDAAPGLHFIGRVGSGMENIDHDYAVSRGIHCLNAPEGNRDSVGEHALGLLLSLMNNITSGDREVRQARWRREAHRGHELMGKTVAIIGFGNTGSAFAERLKGFGVRVIAYDKYKSGFGSAIAEEVSMGTVFEEADVLSLHVPLTPETKYLVSEEYIRKFRKKFWLINTSRGPVVDTGALTAALGEGRVNGAGLDVLEYEKRSFEALQQGDWPQAFMDLTGMPNVVLSPHVAGWTRESLEKLARVLVDKIAALDTD